MNSVNGLDFERKMKFDAYGHMRGDQFFQALLVSILGILNSDAAAPVSLHFYWPSSGAAAIVLKVKYCFCCLFYCCQEGQRANDTRACKSCYSSAFERVSYCYTRNVPVVPSLFFITDFIFPSILVSILLYLFGRQNVDT